MGNWRTVTIIGTCPPNELEAVREATRELTDAEWGADKTYEPLMRGRGLCGLNDWPAERMDVSGNLYERDFGVEDVADNLRRLAEVAPGLRLKVHCGGDWEADECVATVNLDENGVTVGPPETTHVRGASSDEVAGRLMSALLKPNT